MTSQKTTSQMASQRKTSHNMTGSEVNQTTDYIVVSSTIMGTLLINITLKKYTRLSSSYTASYPKYAIKVINIYIHIYIADLYKQF